MDNLNDLELENIWLKAKFNNSFDALSLIYEKIQGKHCH